ncbi:hypothetical protein RQP46_009031 [Phenoliferia psychrophenolica]
MLPQIPAPPLPPFRDSSKRVHHLRTSVSPSSGRTYTSITMRRVMETMARDMALWENGGVEGHLARRGRVYDANELLEAIELALDADDPSQFPLPNPYNIPLVPTSLMAVQVNRLFHKIKDVCHVESGREGEFANG